MSDSYDDWKTTDPADREMCETAEEEEERNYLREARALLAGRSALLCELRHLEAIEELREVTLIQIANALEALKQEVLKK